MSTRYILNADDYGPIDFINRGVKAAVRKGIINSVQVLVNYDLENTLVEDKLYNDLYDLYSLVPQNSMLDLGIHFTLSSGPPLYKAENKTIKQTWGDMVYRKDGNYYFTPYTNFHFDWVYNKTRFEPLIKKEFEMQLQRLKEKLALVDPEGKKLRLTSSTSHHNLHLTSRHLLAIYLEVVESAGLGMRSPLSVPKQKDKMYFSFVLPLLNMLINQDHQDEMKYVIKQLEKKKYPGGGPMVMKTPDHTDISYYKGLGTLFSGTPATDKKVSKQIKKFRKMAEREHTKDSVVEFVFHLGQGESDDFDAMVSHYPGVNGKYFDNRRIELKALAKARWFGSLAHVFLSKYSWDIAREITFD